MKIHFLTILISAFIFTSCSSSCGSSQQANSTANTATNLSNAATSANSQTANASQPGAPKVIAQSPTEVMNALNEAAKTSDTATIKALISKGTLALLEESARQQKTTVDELLKRDQSVPFEETPEIRNEKITGDKATLELKNTLSGQYSTVPFVREDGSWKIALDVYLKEIEQKMREQMNQPADSKSAPSGK